MMLKDLLEMKPTRNYKINMNLKNLKILVTGGAGFIGSNLCTYLIKSGSFVKCLDNFSTGFQKNIKPLINNERFELIEGDIRDLKTCQDACKNIDYVLHHAALGSVPRSLEDPILTNQVNIDGFLNMLVASRDNNIRRFIFAASSSTYGDSPLLPKEEDVIGKPLSPYGITKLVNEIYAEIFKTQYGLDFIGLRYFNVYGPHQDPLGHYSAVIPNFINKLITHSSPKINGNGSFSRDFTFIEDVIQINTLSILTTKKSSVNQIYNTAGGSRTTLLELTAMLKDILVKYDESICDIPFVFGPERKGDIPHSFASIEKARNRLGYSPKFNLKEGLLKSIEWYINNLN